MIAAWYAIVSLMLIIYVVCRQDAGGASAGDCRDRAALVVA
jgi:hypothetical protein